MPFQKELLGWNAPGVEPPQSLKDTGWEAQQKPPAPYFNWTFHLVDQALKELQENAIHNDQKGVANGVATLGPDGKVPSTQMSVDLGPIEEELAAHQADYVKHPAFATATGAANNYAVTLDPAPASYIEGLGIVVAINADSTAASSLNVNGLGAIPIKKANGNTVSNLKSNGIYTVRYNAATKSFILQGEGASGNATASDLLSGKTASTDAGDITGDMPNRGAVEIVPGTSPQNIPEGYHNGLGAVLGDSDLIASNIKAGIDIYGVAGAHYDFQPGSFFIAQADTSRNANTDSYTKVKEIGVSGEGIYTVSFKFGTNYNVTGMVWNAQIYVNNEPFGIVREINSYSSPTFSEELKVPAGALVQIFAKTSNPGYPCTISQFKIGVKPLPTASVILN